MRSLAKNRFVHSGYSLKIALPGGNLLRRQCRIVACADQHDLDAAERPSAVVKCWRIETFASLFEDAILAADAKIVRPLLHQARNVLGAHDGDARNPRVLDLRPMLPGRTEHLEIGFFK